MRWGLDRCLACGEIATVYVDLQPVCIACVKQYVNAKKEIERSLETSMGMPKREPRVHIAERPF